MASVADWRVVGTTAYAAVRAVSLRAGDTVVVSGAAGGVGSLDDLVAGVIRGGADAVLAASIFHYGESTIGEAKQRMAAAGIEVRL